MAIIQKEYCKCDSCGKEMILDLALDSRWHFITPPAMLAFMGSNGIVTKNLNHLCSKTCFYDLVKESKEVKQEIILTTDLNDNIAINNPEELF